MIGITLTTDQIRSAPQEVRQWIEHEVIASLGLAADAPATAPPCASRPSCRQQAPKTPPPCCRHRADAGDQRVFRIRPARHLLGRPPVMAFRLIDICITPAAEIGQVMACLDEDQPGVRADRRDPSASSAASTMRAIVHCAGEQASVAATVAHRHREPPGSAPRRGSVIDSATRV